jgi:peptidyl-tRNA hydrolase
MTKVFVQDARDNEPVLWILMRTDLASMNPGKAVAQGAHAANMALLHARELSQELLGDDATIAGGREILDLINDWEEDRGFGTTITLGVDGKQLALLIEFASADMDLISGVVHDPTYPLRDGAVTHLIPLDTCGYVFARRGWIEDLLDELSLMA